MSQKTTIAARRQDPKRTTAAKDRTAERKFARVTKYGSMSRARTR